MNEEQKKEIDRARAYGLMRGACEGMALRLPKEEQYRIEKIMKEADDLWDGKPLIDDPTCVHPEHQPDPMPVTLHFQPSHA